MKKLLILSMLITSVGYSQITIADYKSFDCTEILKSGDIENALVAGATKKITLKCSPVGAGEKVEVASGKKKDKYYFEKENNIVWVKFTAGKNGNMNLTLRPLSEQDDYDFLLFKVEGKNTISQIKSKKLKPIRSNISRNNIENKGQTGLSVGVKETHIVSGVNNEFSKLILVEEGEEYYLALNNVYDEGKGAIIYFNYFLIKKIKGIVKNDKDEIVTNANVSWEDGRTGKVLVETTSDAKTGEFEMDVPYEASNPKQKYILSAYTEKHFFKEEVFTPASIKNLNDKPINLVLNQLKKGKKNKVHNINFIGAQATFLAGAYPSLKRLHTLMKKNKSLKIVIEGHTNGCDGGVESTQLLSENRAKAVESYLTENGIDEDRISTKGFNCKYMLYPNPINEIQSSLNRRVEILITDL